ncbi:tyrosine--tRNA ligase [Chryseobacterium kwangjuense]|uniref:Tyrosine--tRNA ligase n=1 Tax=Chryseobacterium kwangjuense TaxID=267125 RepID=A0A135WKZ1_9FLAO|nr:tyrosine--tRNA ligase [Chryseobacterium kwangjuense]KXH85576.1 tyrosine--tRNA ligase [Chryseobacterium kwangjuense]
MISTLQENTAIILPENGLDQKLKQAEKENRKLTVKLGFDPTAPDLHLGHAVVLKKLKQFQELGHQVVIVVGSFTARIGDPTGKNKARKPLSADDVEHNARTYINQLSKILDMEKTKIVFNSEWLDALSFAEIIQLMSKVTVAQLMHRNDFNKRFTKNTPIAMHELVYPILQGFDSVQIECDIEMGGTDQLFNCTMGRQLQEVHQMPAQTVMCMPLLKGLDGKEKMSKSLNNIIGLTDEPNEMFGKTMSIPDSLIDEFIELAADFSAGEKKNLQLKLENGENPMHIKKLIAKNIIAQYHDQAAADMAELFFSNQFQNKNSEEKVYEPVSLALFQWQGNTMKALELCSRLKSDLSKSAVRRLIQSGGIQINHLKVTDSDQEIELLAQTKIKIGRRDFFELL